MTDDALKQLLDFDESDLAANRNGVLTERQRKRNAQKLSSMQKMVTVSGIGFMALAVVACLLGVVLMALAYNPRRPEQMIGAGAAVVCVPLMIFAMGLGFLYIARNFKQPTLEMGRVEGPVNVVKFEYRSGRSSRQIRTEITVNGERFVTDSRASQYLVQGEVWAIYYLKENNELMSMERVRGGV